MTATKPAGFGNDDGQGLLRPAEEIRADELLRSVGASRRKYDLIDRIYGLC